MYRESGKTTKFKRVPALDKCFRILALFADTERPLCVSEIARDLNYNKSTVFNLVHTLTDLDILEQLPEKRYRFGTLLYSLGKSSGKGSELISTVHPHLEEISRKTNLSAFLLIRSDDYSIILDKVDSPDDVSFSSVVGARIPLTAGASGKVLLSQFSDDELERYLSMTKLEKFTSASCTDPKEYRAMVKRVGKEGFAIDDEEYVEGIRAVAVPLHHCDEKLIAAIWAAGLKSQIRDDDFPSFKSIFQHTAKKIENRFWTN
jgi:IclR family KDG regulon transcriptional repressor